VSVMGLPVPNLTEWVTHQLAVWALDYHDWICYAPYIINNYD
jgi:hypothetical protein